MKAMPSLIFFQYGEPQIPSFSYLIAILRSPSISLKAFNIMFTNFKLIAVAATFLASQSFSSAIPSTSVHIAPRGGGYPASNDPGVTCYNTWETVTNDVSIPVEYARSIP